jgi:hypothetical protein
MEIFEIRSHHKQAIIKLINCITNSNETICIANHTNCRLFERLAQIISVHESMLFNKINININSNERDLNELCQQIRNWILSYYNSDLFINQLFVDIKYDNNQDLDSSIYLFVY